MKSPGVAAVLSFLWAGLGQIYNGQLGKGLAMLLVYAVSLAVAVLAGVLGLPFVAVALVLWIFGMIDAYKTAERLNAVAARPGDDVAEPGSVGGLVLREDF